MSLGSDYNDDSFQCGKIREDYVVTLENRKKAPPTILVGDYVIDSYYYDTPVNNKGYCVPYNCPLLIKIHSPEFQSTDLNGYYVLNYPPTFQSKNIRVKVVKKILSEDFDNNFQNFLWPRETT